MSRTETNTAFRWWSGGRRSGTHNTAGIVAFGAALECLAASRLSDIERLGHVKQLSGGLISHELTGVQKRLAGGNSSGILQLVIQGIEVTLLVLLERQGVMARRCVVRFGGYGSVPCLAAMGFDREQRPVRCDCPWMVH